MSGRVPVGFCELWEAVTLGEGEHGFGLGSVEGGLVGLAETAVEELGLIHSSKRNIMEAPLSTINLAGEREY